MLEEYDIKSTDLPKIKRTDPALPDDAEPGDVIKIVRDSRTTEERRRVSTRGGIMQQEDTTHTIEGVFLEGTTRGTSLPLV